MFNSRLEQTVTNVPGGQAAVLMGFDGIPVDMYASGGKIDIETIGMEFSVLLKEVRKAAQMLDTGETRELTVRTEKQTTVLRVINEEYFLAFALSPEGNLGKARFLLRLLAPEFNEELS